MNNIFYELTINFADEVTNFNAKKFIQIKGIENGVCYRCGNKNLYTFKNKIQCNNCLEFGLVDDETIFYQKINEKKRKFLYDDLLHELKLSSKQLIASQFIFSCIKMNKDCLIHAVCGAGKTEITFNAISYYLKQNEYICFAIPRIDILYDVYERLQYYFYKTKICILNSSETKIQHGQIYVMTTNQIIKFKNCFKLIIVDEIDAFPYEYNSKYDYGVQNAKKKSGSVVYLTSTPSQNVIKKNLPTYLINKRWHNNKLPVPIFKYFNIQTFLKNSNKPFIKELQKYYSKQYIANKRQLLIFISNIKLGYEIKNKLKNENINLDFVYANCENRRENIQKFKNYKTKIMLSTTILERGITFNNIDVIVLDSSSPLYTKASLIQIAGRVRRKLEYQKGEVYFYFDDITAQMKECKKDIKQFNN